MRITSTDVQAVLQLTKRVFTGFAIAGKYILAGNDGTPHRTTEISTGSDVESSIVIDDSVYEVPAIVRLRKVKLEDWQQKHLLPSVIDEAIKQHYDYMTAIGLKPSSLYFDV